MKVNFERWNSNCENIVNYINISKLSNFNYGGGDIVNLTDTIHVTLLLLNDAVSSNWYIVFFF
uniref:Uncharacterized protein n=1 Tax=Megaselia scalaris TaxID=36166 RepID=T1GTD9_MEGSC